MLSIIGSICTLVALMGPVLIALNREFDIEFVDDDDDCKKDNL